jgi:hypothetical protein
VGSIIGAIAGGGKGGAGVGAGGAAGWVGNHHEGRPGEVPSETLLDFTLQQDVSVPTRRN